jgi:hypothetical protein
MDAQTHPDIGKAETEFSTIIYKRARSELAGDQQLRLSALEKD